MGFLLNKVSILCVLPLWKADIWKDVLSTGGAHALFECSKMCPNVLWRERGIQFLFKKMRTYSFACISFNMIFYIDVDLFFKCDQKPVMKNVYDNLHTNMAWVTSLVYQNDEIYFILILESLGRPHKSPISALFMKNSETISKHLVPFYWKLWNLWHEVWWNKVCLENFRSYDTISKCKATQYKFDNFCDAWHQVLLGEKKLSYTYILNFFIKEYFLPTIDDQLLKLFFLS